MKFPKGPARLLCALLAPAVHGTAWSANETCFKPADMVDWMALDSSNVFVWVTEKRKAFEVTLQGKCARLRYADMIHFAADAGGLVCDRPGYKLLVSGTHCDIQSVKPIED